MKKAVILAAGWGTRLKPLTFTRPKPALRILDETLIEHNLNQLCGLFDEVIIVIGYKGEVIKDLVGDFFCGIPVKYVEQNEQLGTGHAALTALPFLDEQFIILNGDDLYLKEDVDSVMEKNPSIMLKEVENPKGYGQVVVDGEVVKKMVEKPDTPLSNLVNIGCYYLNKDFFTKQIEKSSRGEYEITDYVENYLEENPLYFKVAEDWNPISYPWNIFKIVREVFETKEDRREGVIEEGVIIKGKVILEEGSVIKSGTYIEGPVYVGKDSVVGPNAYLRPYTVIHDSCHIGQSVEVKESVIFSNTNISHLSYIGDSVIGEGCNIGAGTIFANLLFKDYSVKAGNIDTKRKKMGAIIGDGVKIGINCSIMPGTIVGNNALIYPHQIISGSVDKDAICRTTER